jgi:hypothetical protein
MPSSPLPGRLAFPRASSEPLVVVAAWGERGRAPSRRYRARGRRARRRSGLGFWGPFPSYSTRTRRGTHVRVTGCCLPLALAPFAAAALGVRLAVRH